MAAAFVGQLTPDAVARPSYESFVASKLQRIAPTGMATDPCLSASLFPFQRDIVRWALRRGRCAVFADTGLGKSRMQVEWARHVAAFTGGRVLILTPLAVGPQTVEEASKIGVAAGLAREAGDTDARIVITNYERLHKFDPGAFAGVVLDESSCIKHKDAKTFRILTDAFRDTAWKLCATATPAPNDYTELGTHAEFLGICTRQEMLAEYFCHDGGETQTWRLKGHARDLFWRWVAGWGCLVRKPSDLGYDDGAYALPPLNITQHALAVDHEIVREAGALFAFEARTLSERRNARRASVTARVAECAALVNATREPFVVWCDLNAESEALTKAIDGAVEVRGSMTIDEKESALAKFASGEARVIVTKASISGWGLNWQHCHRMAFVGVTDSWEAYYQAVRRCWRFGQTMPVDVHVFTSELEGAVTANLARKEADGVAMSAELAAIVRETVHAEVTGTRRITNAYAAPSAQVPSWLTSEEAP